MSKRCFNQVVLFAMGLGLLFSAGIFVSAEEAKMGKLVITNATYGDLPSGDKIDVTAKVAEMVKDGKLSVEATNENFTDPAEGIVKKLTVDYTIDGVKGSKTVEEDQTLSITALAIPAPIPAGKLVIQKAEYGDLPDGAKSDVTMKVKEAVANGKLSIEATNDNFGDPAEGIVKKLTVTYTYEGVGKSKTVEEGVTLTISAKGE